ncbi:hypothetical protein C8R45DRAFT_474910 [Mycena sanguinolenta]|nr:hypothetical protein C8R45DRAFT_474910 [Mycena sanguinolenta]
MPPNRTDTASARRARREQHLAVRTVSSNAPADSISAPGKLEPPTSPTITIPARPIPQTRFHTQSPSKPQTKPWRHADELPFIRTSGKTWPDMAIARFLRATAISIPPAPVSTSERFIHVRCGDGYDVALPRGYRLPLLWVVKFLWSSVPIVMSEAGEWDDKKFDLLHVARLIDALLSGARRIQEEREKRGKAMDRSYRCAAFDRALRRYWHRWLVMRDEFVRDFWREFEEDEFKEDVLKLGWYTWVLKGHKGFYLTKDEVTNGLTSDDFLREFVVDEQKKTFAWVGAVPESQSVSPAGAEPPAAVAPMPLPQNELFLPPLKKARTDKSASASTSAAVAPRPANPSPTKRARKVPPKTLDRPQSILEQPIRAPWPSSSSSPSPPLNRRPSTSALSVPKQAQLHASISLPVVDVQKQPKAHQSKSKGPVVPTLNGNTKGKSATADANATANANANEAQNANAKAKAGADGSENRNAKAKATVNANARAPVHGSVSLAELVSRIPLGGGRHRLHNLHSNIFDERPSLSVPPPPPLHNANAGVGAQSHSIVMPLVSEVRIHLRCEELMGWLMGQLAAKSGCGCK